MRLSEFHHEGQVSYYWRSYVQLRVNHAIDETRLKTMLTEIRSDLVRLKFANEDSEQLFRLARLLESELAERSMTIEAEASSIAA